MKKLFALLVFLFSVVLFSACHDDTLDQFGDIENESQLQGGAGDDGDEQNKPSAVTP